MNNFVYMWLVVAIVSACFELVSPGLFLFLSFSIGAGVSAFVAFFSYSLMVQSIIFLLMTVSAALLLKKWVERKTSLYHGYHRTNIHALIGKRALVCKAIKSDHAGEVKIGGELWLARTVHDVTILEGEYVEVKDVRGAHVVVVPILKK